MPFPNVSNFMSQMKIISVEAFLLSAFIVHISSINFIMAYCKCIKQFFKIVNYLKSNSIPL